MGAKNNRSSNTNGREEGVSTAVIEHRDKSPIFQAPEHVFNRVSLFIQSDIVSLQTQQ